MEEEKEDRGRGEKEDRGRGGWGGCEPSWIDAEKSVCTSSHEDVATMN